MKAIIIRWLPWSGKSTFAKSLEWYIHISKDIIREEHPDWSERQVNEYQDRLIDITMKTELDIVIDNTHILSDSWISIVRKLKKKWYEVEIFDMIEKYTDKLEYHRLSHEQNMNREKKVPWSVIDLMYLTEYADTINDNVYVFDIDGTIANLDHRLHYVKGEWKKDWDWFYSKLSEDTPIKATVDLLKILYHSYNKIILCSGRPDIHYWTTVNWLRANDIPYDYILMRGWWDRQDDTIAKENFHNKVLSKLNVKWIFDDRPRVVDMWRKKGHYVFDVNQTRAEF